jgi:hypothetical protein
MVTLNKIIGWEIAGNALAGLVILKIFLWGMPPDPLLGRVYGFLWGPLLHLDTSPLPIVKCRRGILHYTTFA